MFTDLHIHTTFSDSTLTPEAVAQEAKRKGFTLISVCDHNTTKSYPQLIEACQKEGIHLIPGVEIDAQDGGQTLHILAYGCDLQNTALQSLLLFNSHVMEDLSVDLIAAMSKDHSDLCPAEYENYERDPLRGGWKGIDYLKSKGYPADYPECMHYYADYGIKVRQPFESVETVCSIIHEAGGKAVLAHPGDRLPNEKQAFVENLERLRGLGIDGVECYYPSHSDEITALALRFCKEHGLLVTAGSDSHGEFAKFVKGVEYYIGAVEADKRGLNLEGILPV